MESFLAFLAFLLLLPTSLSYLMKGTVTDE